MSYRLKTAVFWLAITFTACNTGTEPTGTQNPPGPTGPTAPTNLVATAMSSSQIRLTWTDASSDETGFAIERCAGAGCSNFAAFRNAPANSGGYVDLSVVASTSYSYRVQASNNAGASSFSNTASTVTLAAAAIPAAPTSPTATAINSSRIDVGWTDASTTEDGFRIERCQGTACTDFAVAATTLTPNGQSVSFTGLTASTRYRFRIQAYNGGGGSSFAGPVESMTAPAPAAPAAPSALVATPASSSRINLTWADNSANEDAFIVERCQGAGCSSFAGIGSTPAASWSDQSLSASTSYSYRVKAMNGAGSSSYAGIATAVTANAVSVPEAPTGLAATATSTSSITLTWTDPASNEDGFRIERCQGAGCTNFAFFGSTAANVTTYQNVGLSPATTYSYRVQSFNGAGASAFTAGASATTQTAQTAPAAPSNLVATVVSSSRIDLSWTDNSNNEDGFTVERCVGAGCTAFITQATTGANVRTYSNTALTASTSYTYRVRAFNTVGTTVFTATATAVTSTGLLAPALATPTVSGTSVTVTWTYTWPGLASSADRFDLEESSTSATTGYIPVYALQARPASHTYTLTGRSPGTYYYRVRAYTSEGYTPYSTVRSVTVVSTPPIISVSVTSRTFNATAGGANPGNQLASIGNSGGGTLTGLVLTEDPPASWLAVTLSSTTAPATMTFQVTTGTLAAGTYTTALRVSSSVATNSPQTVTVTFNVAGAGQPSTLRIINDLPGTVAGPNNWGLLNTVVRLRVGPTQSSVINMTAGAYELLFNGDATSSTANTLDINPGQTQTFTVSMMTGPYYLYIQNGYWDYFAESGLWEKHMSAVVGCDGGSTVYKGTIIQITQPFGNPEEIRLSDWLPIGNYYGSQFCN